MLSLRRNSWSSMAGVSFLGLLRGQGEQLGLVEDGGAAALGVGAQLGGAVELGFASDVEVGDEGLLLHGVRKAGELQGQWAMPPCAGVHEGGVFLVDVAFPRLDGGRRHVDIDKEHAGKERKDDDERIEG